MELNYQYLNGRYEKVRHSKIQKMNEILNLKHFQEEVDRRIRKFEYVVHSSEFATSILHKLLIYAIALFALVASILFVISYLRVDSTTYRKVAAYNQVLESKAELGNGILTNNTISAAQDLAALTVPPEKFFDCVYFDKDQKKGVKCTMEETRIALNVSKNDQDAITPTGSSEENKSALNAVDSPASKRNGQQNDFDDEKASPDDMTSLAQLESSFQLPKGRSAHSDAEETRNDKDNTQHETESKHKTREDQKKTPSDSQGTDTTQVDKQTPTKTTSSATKPNASIEQNQESADLKPKKSINEPNPSTLFKNQKNSNESSSHHKYSQSSDKENISQAHKDSTGSKHHHSSYSRNDANINNRNQRRNLQAVYNETSSNNQTTSTESVNSSASDFDQFLKSPLIIEGNSYYLKRHGYLQKLTNSQIGLTTFLVINLVAITILVIAKKVTKNEIDSRLNRLIIEMMFEENSQSDTYKFYIFGSYEYIDVKVDAVNQAPGDKTNLLLTGNDQLNAGRVRPVSSATKMNQYFESNGKEDSKDTEERRLIKDKDFEIQHTSYECWLRYLSYKIV